MNKVFKVGDTGTYIHNHGSWSYVCDIPFDAACLWLEQTPVCWDVKLGCEKLPDECWRVEEDWMNKMFIVVADDPKEIALYNHHGVIKVYEK